MEVQRNRALMLEALSDQLLRWGLTDTWRDVFLAKSTDGVLFLQRPFTILCSDAPTGSANDEAIAMLANRHGGSVQPAGTLDIALSFEDPPGALRTAVALQRLAKRTRLRTAITTGVYTAALVVIDNERRSLILDGGVAAAELQALATPPGSIHIEPETYELLQKQIGSEVSTAMVMREMHGERPGAATLTLPPAACADLSTFAGLGLT